MRCQLASSNLDRILDTVDSAKSRPLLTIKMLNRSLLVQIAIRFLQSILSAFTHSLRLFA